MPAVWERTAERDRKEAQGNFLFYIDCGCSYRDIFVMIHEAFHFKWVNHVLCKA